MATYKVLQDIEAEDKLLGPFTLKQFIFAAIAIAIGVAMFFIGTSPAPVFIKTPFIAVLSLPLFLFGFLAAPISRDQPNEIWLLARVNFLFKPRKRIWSQDGISELVTITVPKKVVHTYTNGLSQTEVKSRLQALANTVDSRGWAVKNVNANLFAQPGYLTTSTDSDRLIDPSSLPQEVPTADITASDDMLDIANNSTAQNLDRLVQASTASQRSKAVSNMKQETKPQSAENYWFMNQAAPAPEMPLPTNYAVFQAQQVVSPGAGPQTTSEETAEEHALAEKLAKEGKAVKPYVSDHMKVLQPIHNRDGSIAQPPQPTPQLNPVDPFASLAGLPQDNTPITPTPPKVEEQGQNGVNPAILGLAHNDDLNVATIARQAKRISEDDGEVVISLH